MVVPTFRGPGYGAQLAGMMQAGAADRLKAMLEARALETDTFQSLMANSEKIAGIAGSGALDRIAIDSGYTNDALFGGEYADVMDRWRMQDAAASVAAKNRSGTGGGGGGGGSASPAQKSDESYVRAIDANGNVVMERNVKTNSIGDLDMMFRGQGIRLQVIPSMSATTGADVGSVGGVQPSGATPPPLPPVTAVQVEPAFDPYARAEQGLQAANVQTRRTENGLEYLDDVTEQWTPIR